MIALAATQADQVPWLLQTYERAIEAAKQHSHLKALILKYALIKLHKNWLYDYGRAEALMEEIAPIISIRHSPPIEEVDEVTMAIARDYCRI
jgi:hypothetical protein